MSNIIESIGALELNHASVLLSDGTLEATAVDVGPTATVTANHPFTYCPRIDDSAFEATGFSSVHPSYGIACTTTKGQLCRRIDDGALEASAGQAMAGPTIAPCTVMTCPRIDDSELETVAAMTASPSFDTTCGSTIGPRCFRGVDDGALEAMVVSAGPNLGPPTGRGWTGACCGRIDDSALEATGLSSINPSYGIACSSTQGPMCRRIDEDTN